MMLERFPCSIRTKAVATLAARRIQPPLRMYGRPSVARYCRFQSSRSLICTLIDGRSQDFDWSEEETVQFYVPNDAWSDGRSNAKARSQDSYGRRTISLRARLCGAIVRSWMRGSPEPGPERNRIAPREDSVYRRGIRILKSANR